MSEFDTQPTIQNVLERIESLRDDMLTGFKEVFRRLDVLESRLERTERRQSLQDEKIDLFILDVIEMKRSLRQPV